MKYEIKIPESCHEDWAKMSVSERGRFCGACKKEVVDFTKYTNKELADELDFGKKICGRFLPEQLNTPLTYVSQTKNSHLSLLLGLGSLLSLTSFHLNAKTTLTPLLSEQNTKEITYKGPSKTTTKTIIRGRVFNEDTEEKLAFVYVHIRGTGIVTETDPNGMYEVEIPRDYFTDSTVVMELNYIGYEKKSIVINQNSKVIDVPLKGDNAIYGKKNVAQTMTVILGNVSYKEVKKPIARKKSILSDTNEHEQNTTEIEIAVDDNNDIKEKTAIEKENFITITGKITEDDTGEALLGANIYIENTNRGVISDINGLYELQVPLNYFKNKTVVLKCNYVGFEDYSTKVNKNTSEIDISLKIGSIMGVIIIKQNHWQRLKNIFRKKHY